VRSASRHIPRAGILALCGVVVIGNLTGCTTTQEKAAREQAQAKRTLKANEQEKLERATKGHRLRSRKR
jgi:hypothetical protein